jgi:hypothetical protein
MRTRAVVGLGLLFIGVVGYVSIRQFSFAADVPHSKFVFDGIELFKNYSIHRDSREVSVPNDLDNTERLRRTSGNYEAMCSTCHLKPGIGKSELSKGLYPAPPNLTLTRSNSDAASDFWIIKHGIKGSAMPSWGSVGLTDEEIWDLVAFVQKIPEMTKEKYNNYLRLGFGHRHSHN